MQLVLQAQDCLYTLVLKHSDGTMEPRVIGSLASYLFAPGGLEAVIEKIAAPGTRIVSLTITEGGYGGPDTSSSPWPRKNTTAGSSPGPNSR
jgi:mannitol 2-dehydrogenase